MKSFCKVSDLSYTFKEKNEKSSESKKNTKWKLFMSILYKGGDIVMGFRKRIASGGRFWVRWCFDTKNAKDGLKSNAHW